jgi:sugar transferase (PEP-CTERM/EpsH1 system associated)
MRVLYLTHCVPDPPDKGEKIRAHHVLRRLTRRHEVHLVCFARDRAEMEAARALEGCCASVHVALLRKGPALARGSVRFALGGSLTEGFYASRRLRSAVAGMRLDAAVAYSTPMAQYAPSGVPLVLDMTDVDSEKWLGYGRTRRPGFLYSAEGRRLRLLEKSFARRACVTLLATEPEEALLRGFAPDAATRTMGNGVDLERFDPAVSPRLPELEGRRFLVFVGAMDYYPNADGACWFAREVYPGLRRLDPGLELFLVGRDPVQAVRKLAGEAGVSVTGTVKDVRPYLAGALAAVAPLRIARGIQNKVLEALAMGKRVLASQAVCETFGSSLPLGVTVCRTAEEFMAGISGSEGGSAEAIRRAAAERFCWERTLNVLDETLEGIEAQCGHIAS